MLIQADQAFGGLEGLLDGPSASGDPDQDGQRHRPWRPAAVIGQLAGLVVAAQQQPVLAWVVRVTVARVKLDKCPVVQAVAFGAAPSRHALPGLRWDPGGQRVGAIGAPPAITW
jgi:hypothetical protein